MPVLEIEDFPADLYEALARAARVENRSIAQETVVLLRDALAAEQGWKARRRAVLAQVAAADLPDTSNWPDSADLIREDRDR